MTTRQATKTHVKSFPAPAHLATVTDLIPQEVQAVTETVNPLIADAVARKPIHDMVYTFR